MTVEATPGTPAPAVTPAPVTVHAPVITAPAPNLVVTVDDLPPEALKQRIDQAKRAAQTELLASLGVTDPAQAKAAIDAAKAAEDAKKSSEQRIAEQNVRLTSLESAVDAAIAQAAATLTPERKAEIDAVAGNDKALWLKVYGLEKKPAVTTAPVTPAPVPGAAPVVPAAPSSTAPATPAPAPAGGNPTSPTDHVAVYASLKTTNPFAASAYLNQHGDACYPKT